MPRLGSLLVCEKIIIDQQHKPSLISTFQSISAVVPEGQHVPEGTVTFVPWAIYAEWFFVGSETKGKVEQVVELLQPDGAVSSIGGRLQLQEFAPEGQGTRAYVNLFGMPIAQPGYVTVNVWIEEDSKKITDVFPYRIKIEHTAKPAEGNVGSMSFPAATLGKP
jgi:hypothetical protein